MWLKFVDQVSLTRWDLFGGCIVIIGALVIILQPQVGQRSIRLTKQGIEFSEEFFFSLSLLTILIHYSFNFSLIIT
ncbi:unnamed protein product [Oppiella nova]|uniref:Uncharacterized protein n=1 Tax=Oppiella nova TaxID=334625 RepID=A0A7R9L847_9ACAR|nr:unnamed protein product [Oppiella nova]CAG2157573.1 unnamed protein product [Oppiella nova]